MYGGKQLEDADKRASSEAATHPSTHPPSPAQSTPPHPSCQLGSTRLRLSTPVVSIRHGDSNATVVTAAGQELSAQYIICTAPLGVLKAGHLVMDPALPEATQMALGRVGVGHLEKLWLQFDDVRAVESSGGQAEVGQEHAWEDAAGRR